jgi:hypothetical protein
MTSGRTRPKSQNTSLPMAESSEQLSGLDRHEQEALNAVIGEQVIHALGEPADLLAVSVRPLWETYYRVNVFVGPDVTSARVANSYFLEIDAEGKITAATPKITRRY